MNSNRFPTLAQFFGGYLHQDWPLEFTNWPEAMRAFVADAPSQDVSALQGELDMALEGDDDQLNDLLLSLHCYYDPLPDGLAPRQWLVLVRKAVGGRQSD